LIHCPLNHQHSPCVDATNIQPQPPKQNELGNPRCRERNPSTCEDFLGFNVSEAIPNNLQNYMFLTGGINHQKMNMDGLLLLY
jgi:hypothetical protein